MSGWMCAFVVLGVLVFVVAFVGGGAYLFWTGHPGLGGMVALASLFGIVVVIVIGVQAEDRHREQQEQRCVASGGIPDRYRGGMACREVPG